MKKAIFVDDEPLIAAGLSSILDWDQYGIEIIGTANDGESALDIYHQTEVDLIITDIMMPRMNGLDLIRNIREHDKKTKFIILSGYEEFEYVKAGIRLGIENYILKPINLEELESTIRHIRGEWDRDELHQVRIEEDSEILRSNILQRWVNGDIERQEFRHRAELLGFPLDRKQYNLFLARPLSVLIPDESEQSTIELGNASQKLAKALEQNRPAAADLITFIDADRDLVILYFSSESLNEFSLSSLIDETSKKVLLGEREVAYLITPGVSGNDFMNVHPSYEAAKMIFRRYLAASGNLLSIVESVSLEEEKLREPEWSEEEYAELLIEGSPGRVEQYIERIFAQGEGDLPVEREPWINAALRFMLPVKEREQNPDYIEVFAPLELIYTLAALKAHTLQVVRSSMKRQESDTVEYSPHVAFLVEQVHRHYAEELSLKTLSHKLELHPNYLGQLFQQEIGNSFSDYLNQYRIEKATELLLHTERRTAEIAQHVGYLDSSYFYRQFKKYAGVSPTELRNMYIK